MLKKIFQSLDKWIEMENKQRSKDGALEIQKAEILVLGQTALIEYQVELELVATVDIDAYVKAQHEVKPGAIRRLSLRVDIEKLVRMARADHLGRTTEESLQGVFPGGDWLLEQSQKLNVLLQKPKPFLTGKFLLSLGMQPGPAMGDFIQASFELQLEGDILDVTAAEEWAKTHFTGTLW